MLMRVFFTTFIASVVCMLSTYSVFVWQTLDVCLDWIKNVPSLDKGYLYATWSVVTVSSLFFLLNFFNFGERNRNPQGNLTLLFLTSCLLVVAGTFLVFHYYPNQTVDFCKILGKM